MKDFQFNHENLSSKVAALIRNRIIFKEHYKEGEKLSESNIAKELEVSRAPVREAFRELENQGLIESIPRKGSYVVEFNEEDMKEIFDIRVLLESRIFESLIKEDKLDEEDFIKLEKIVDEMMEIAKTDNEQKVIELNQKDTIFHEYLWKKSERKWTQRILSNLYYQLQLAMINDLKNEGDLIKSSKIHYEIIDHLRQKNLKKSKQVLAQHIMVYNGSDF